MVFLLSSTNTFAQCTCLHPNGAYSTPVGPGALASLDSTGGANVGVGYFAGAGITSGKYSVAIGHSAFSDLVWGIHERNVGMGYRVGWGAAAGGGGNTLIGDGVASYFKGGEHNVMIGKWTGMESGGSNNIFLNGGRSAQGNRNVYIGNGAGSFIQGNNNVFLGTNLLPIDSSYSDRLIIGNINNNEFIHGDIVNGKLGINTDNPQYSLDVCGKARFKNECIINDGTGWCDYVFYDNYQLPTLSEEEKHIDIKGHLIGFQSEKEMAGEIHMADVTKRQQVKIEEMMLHLIEMNKKIAELEAENKRLDALMNTRE